jgi:hypothetical protein
MTTKTFGFATILCAIATTALAAPAFNVVPGGIVSGKWVWNVDVTPDLSLVPDASGTPLALEFGFRLTGAPLLSATIANPSQFDTPNPGSPIFGWETPDPTANNHPVGLQINTSTGEVFAAYGTINFTTPGPKHFLQILASGPPSLSSSIQWLGVYGAGSSQGLVVQINGLNGVVYTTGSYYFSGGTTQSIPEPASAALVAIGTVILPLRRRRQARVA